MLVYKIQTILTPLHTYMSDHNTSNLILRSLNSTISASSAPNSPHAVISIHAVVYPHGIAFVARPTLLLSPDDLEQTPWYNSCQWVVAEADMVSAHRYDLMLILIANGSDASDVCVGLMRYQYDY